MNTFRGIVRQDIVGTWGKGYKETTAVASVYSSQAELPEDTVLLLPGLGEEALTARKLVRLQQQKERNVAVAVLRFPDQLSINFVCMHMPQLVAAEINKRKGLQTDAPLHTVSHSQGGGVLLSCAPQTPQLHDARHVVLSPVGLNTQHFGQTPQERAKTFWKRHLFMNMIKNGQFFDPKNWLTGLDLTKRLASDVVGSLVTNGYNLLPHKIAYALSDDMHKNAMVGLDHLVQHAERVAIMTGSNDPLFPLAELDETLTKHDIFSVALQETVGAHESMAGGLGRLQVEAAFRELNIS